MNDVANLLPNWRIETDTATMERYSSATSFSGAKMWRVRVGQRLYLLRQWPAAWSEERVAVIHSAQWLLNSRGLPVSAPLMTTTKPRTSVTYMAREWELTPWLPGEADYWRNPHPEKLKSALELLANVHVTLLDLPVPSTALIKSPGPSAALSRREDRLHQLLALHLPTLVRSARMCPAPDHREAYLETIELLDRVRRPEAEKSLRWRDVELPLQVCLQDVWHDHVLFTGNFVTGLIDFGAVSFDSPCIDVARLLGSFVGDDRNRWAEGLTAYESVRPLSPLEREAVDYLDTSGTVVSAHNWLAWLWPKPGQNPPTIANRAAALERLRRLVGRLRVLAAA